LAELAKVFVNSGKLHDVDPKKSIVSKDMRTFARLARSLHYE